MLLQGLGGKRRLVGCISVCLTSLSVYESQVQASIICHSRDVVFRSRVVTEKLSEDTSNFSIGVVYGGRPIANHSEYWHVDSAHFT